MSESTAPAVSVIVPVYNVTEYLRACIDSVRAQTFTDWELILIDDGSTDDSGTICDEAAASDARIRVIHQPNRGVSRARNAGLDTAKGTYIAFVDSDDTIVPTYLEKLVGAAETHHTDLVLCGFVRIRPDSEQVYLVGPIPIGFYWNMRDFMQLYGEGRTNMFGISIWAKLYRASVLHENNIRFDPEISYEEDCNFNVDFIPHCKTAVVLGEALYRYRQLDESLSKSYRPNTFHFLIHGFHRRCDLLKQFGRPDLIRAQEQIFMWVIKTNCDKIVRSNLRHRKKIAAYRAIMQCPESQRAAAKRNRSDSVFTNLVAWTVRRKAPRLLSLILQIWNAADRYVLYQRKRNAQKQG